jgi:lipopolysaccharide/colanic/teichoic acid biosynthesis glycosyltransferase
MPRQHGQGENVLDTRTFIRVPPGATTREASWLSASAALPRHSEPPAQRVGLCFNPYFCGPKQWLEYSLLLLLFPFWASLLAVIFALLLIPLRGRVLISQARMGRNGRVFRFYKFRTLRSAVPLPFNKSNGNGTPETVFLGTWLRRTGLDELPQFINVLKGDMHLVGPRPFLERDLESLPERESIARHAIKPGLTGLWQVTRRYDDTDLKFAEVDRQYIRSASAWLDLRILCRTMEYALKQRGR